MVRPKGEFSSFIRQPKSAHPKGPTPIQAQCSTLFGTSCEPRCRTWRAGPSQLCSRFCGAVETTYTTFFRRGTRLPALPRREPLPRRHIPRRHGLSVRGPDRRIGIVGVSGAIKTVWHRAFPLNAKLGNAVVSRRGSKWYAVFSVEAEFGGESGSGDVGIDLGLSTLFATSDGHVESSPSFERRAYKAQRRRQSALAPCRRNPGAARRPVPRWPSVRTR